MPENVGTYSLIASVNIQSISSCICRLWHPEKDHDKRQPERTAHRM
jgi:hypothetical protein